MTKKGNLLLVDDEKDLVEGLRVILEDYADHIFEANDGIEALDILKANCIHCVITDINMPKMNGIELLKEARRRGIQIPFIAYTGHATKDLISELKAYNLMDLLNKPFLEGIENSVEKGLKIGIELIQPLK
jgi:DNA-binding NtrC family response regulator